MYEMGKYDVFAARIMKKKPHELNPIYVDYGLNADGLITKDPWGIVLDRDLARVTNFVN